jgi:hypothetical protein
MNDGDDIVAGAMETCQVERLKHQTTKAMIATLSVMDPTGRVLSSRDIAQRRWPDHTCWQDSSYVRPGEVESGLANTLKRLCDNFHLFKMRHKQYAVTWQGCRAAGLTPEFVRNHHLGDYIDVAVDVIEGTPEDTRAIAALECLHCWALEHGADLPDIKRAKQIAGRAIVVLCASPLLKRGKGTSTLAGRTILHLAEARTRGLRHLEEKGLNRWLLGPLLEATQRKGLQHSARLMVGGAVDICSEPGDYDTILEFVGLQKWSEMSHDIINITWGDSRKMLDRKSWGRVWSLGRYEL